jgi:probable HAF family extracellular repeat protein
MYDVAELSGLPTDTGTHGYGWRVNVGGQVAGFVLTDLPNPGSQAFLWSSSSPGSPVTWLSDLNSVVGDLNNQGQVVGWWSNDLSGEYRTAALWSSSGNDTSLLRLPGVDQQAFGINDAGQVVGYYEISEQGAHTAFLWDPVHGVQSMPSIGGNTSSEAQAINHQGLIVGRSGAEPGVDEVGRAVMWIPGTVGSFELVELNAPDDWVTVAVAIDKYWRIAGWGYPKAAGYDQAHALYWLGAGRSSQMQDLGTLGRQASIVRDMNDVGEIVGYVADSFDSNPRAFHWSSGQMTDLNDQIPADSGWVLEYANGINDDGVIVGVGFYQGQERAFQLTPRRATPVDNLAHRIHQIVVAELTQILYGLTTDGGGAVITPGGVPVPVPPNPTWEALPASTKGLLTGLVLNGAARLVHDPAARRELQRASLNLVRQEVDRQLRALDQR